MSTDDERELTAAEEAEYAALWADLTTGAADLRGAETAAASPPDRLPSDVAARLDGVLSELVRERGPTRVASVAAHRRRARGRWVLAAAAVAVGGFALTPLLTGSGGDSEMGMDAATSGSADSAAEEAAGGSTHSGSDGLLDRDSESAPSPGAIADEVDPQRAPAPPALRPAQLAEDVAALLELGSPPDGEVPVETAADRADGKAQLERDGRMALYSAKGCQAPPAGTWWLVRYDDRRAVLAVVPSAQGGDAIVWPCRGDEPLARVSLAD